MISKLTSPWSLSAMLIINVVTAAPAAAVPMDFIIFRTSTMVDLGTFTVDPDLAAAVGISDVQMTALEFTATVDPFGPLTVTLADLPPGSFRARFFDGQLASVAGLGSGTLSGGIQFFLDFTPFVPPDPSLIDLNAVGTFALDAGDGTIFGDSATGSIGIRPVPEPSTALLLVTAAGACALRRRVRQRAAMKPTR